MDRPNRSALSCARLTTATELGEGLIRRLVENIINDFLSRAVAAHQGVGFCGKRPAPGITKSLWRKKGDRLTCLETLSPSQQIQSLLQVPGFAAS
ncbi:hypothetical protein P3T18_001106 [Paraburkholderia sp. GAS199]|uniref:hypothetical protein n=1 Tax=Paraburkholderia sp. GAS199 TaxID=3035126 RepID=UPI003D21F2B6